MGGEGTFLVEYSGNSVNLTDFQPVPEPGVVSLLSAAGFFLLRRRKA